MQIVLVFGLDGVFLGLLLLLPLRDRDFVGQENAVHLATNLTVHLGGELPDQAPFGRPRADLVCLSQGAKNRVLRQPVPVGVEFVTGQTQTVLDPDRLGLVIELAQPDGQSPDTLIERHVNVAWDMFRSCCTEVLSMVLEME